MQRDGSFNWAHVKELGASAEWEGERAGTDADVDVLGVLSGRPRYRGA